MKNGIIKNIAWSITERLSSQIVFFVVSIFLARMIDPADYGVVATITVIVNIFAGAIQSGFSSALIYKKDPEDEDYSTAFWCTLIMCTLFYYVLFFIAPAVATFYKNKSITLFMRVLSIQIILQGIHSIPFAYISKKMEFKKNYIATIIGVVTSSTVAIVLAINGFGIWALICITSLEVLVSAIVLWCFTRIRIDFVLKLSSAKEMFGYCWKLMGVDVLNSAYSNINSMIIGRKYNTTEVAYYNRAYSLPQTLLGSANTAVSKVLFPAFSESGEKKYILENLRRSIRTINYVVYPMLVGLLLVAEELILVLYTDKWEATIPYLRIMCLIWLFQPIQICVIQAFKAVGKSDEYFKLEIFKKIVACALLFIAVLAFNTPLALAWTLGIGQVLSTLMNAPRLKKIFDYSYTQQFKDVLASMLMCVIMFAVAYVIGLLFSSMPVRLIVRILVGVITYFLLSMLTKCEQYVFLKNMVFRKGAKEE